jgi:hypothetical protein
MPKSHSDIEIGNLVVKFGEQFNLLDMLSEVVSPAFFDSSLKRQYGDTSYLFYKPEFLQLQSEPVIAGRLVKDTVLEREQLLVDGELQDATGTLPSSPSSLFVLLLGCHRLLFVRQHRGAPSMDAFRTTLARFLKKCHRDFLLAGSKIPDSITGKKPTLKELVEKYPYPTVELTPLGSHESIHSFLKKFKTIETVTAHLLNTNSEIDNDGLFNAVRASQSRIKSRRTSLHYENKKQGLDAAEAESQLTALSKQGNHLIKVTGFDTTGEKIEGNNDSFKVKIPVTNLPDALRGAAEVLVQHFLALKSNKIITVPDSDAAAIQKVKNAFDAPANETSTN